MAREAGRRVAAEIVEAGADATFVEADVGCREGARAMIAAAVERFGGLDILVNNAGVSHPNKPFEEVSEAESGLSPARRRRGDQHQLHRGVAPAPRPVGLQQLQRGGTGVDQEPRRRIGAG
jgi:NAD(P)-dependent dehydrogenase (short-subunit alcohol dehydrogenase family)